MTGSVCKNTPFLLYEKIGICRTIQVLRMPIHRKGEGMSNIFNYNNKLFSAFDKVINIFCLSLIWFMACIPVLPLEHPALHFIMQ